MAGFYYPKNPNALQKIGHVVDIMALPCAPTPTIWVQAYFSALPTLIWSLFKPDPFDIGSGRGGRHHKTKKKFILNQMGFERSITAGASNALKWFAFTGGLANKVGWYFVVADAAIDLSVNWTSTAMRWSGCTIPGEPWAELYAEEWYPIPNDGIWHRLTFGKGDDNGLGIDAGLTSIGVIRGISAAFGATVYPGASNDFPDAYRTTGVSIQIREAGSGWVVSEQSEQHDGYGNNTTSTFKKDWTMPGSQGIYECWINATGPVPYGCIKRAWFTAYGQRIHDGLLPDP